MYVSLNSLMQQHLKCIEMKQMPPLKLINHEHIPRNL
jgi:hypothetical protein